MTPRYILQLVEEIFPISNMPSDFSGNHSILIDRDGKLQVAIWIPGDCLIVGFGNRHDEKSEKKFKEFLKALRFEIDLGTVED